MNSKKEIELIDSLLCDNSLCITINTNKLAENHSLILNLTMKKEKNEAKNELLLEEKKILLHYRKEFFKKLIPYMFLPAAFLLSSICMSVVNINSALALLALSSITSVTGIIKFKIRNKSFFKIKKKDIKGINQEISLLEEENHSYDNIIQGTKEKNDILHKKYSDLNNTRKELIMQRQKLLQLSNSQRELEIEKKMIKS